jgi:hypothetical protein
MKKILLAVTALLFVSALSAQDLRIVNKKNAVAVPYNKVQITGRETAQEPEVFSPIMRTSGRNFFGTTYYDCQSNASVSPRIIAHDDGTISAIWITAGPSAASRGTGYNYYNGSSWVNPFDNTNRIESDKTGYPTMTCIGDVEITAAHVSSGLEIGICPQKGTNQWTFSTLPGPTTHYAHGSQTSNWLQWPYMVSTGNIIHLIACTESDTGYLYNGINCCLLYYRGTFNPSENTISWEEPRIVGNVTSDEVKRFGGDSYAIAAKGNTVAIAACPGNQYDNFIWKSTDQGVSFTKTVFCESPIKESYEPLRDTIYLPDGCVSIALGDDGKAHVAMSTVLYMMDSIDDIYYYPSTGYLLYWNDNMSPILYNNNSNFMDPSVLTEAGYKIVNEVNIDCDEYTWSSSSLKYPKYGVGSVSFPQIAAQDGKVYITFSQVLGFPFIYEPTSSYYRGIFGTKFEENANIENFSWISYNKDCYYLSSWDYFPIDTTNVDINEFFSYVEAEGESVYPAMASKIVNGKLNMYWQQDFEAGCYIKETTNASISPNESFLYWITIDADSIGIYNNTNEVCQGLWIDHTGVSNKNISGIKMYPNPASESVNLAFSAEKAESGVVSVMNLMGQTIYTNNVEVNEGYNLINVPVKNFTSGVYMVTLRTNTGISTQKLIVK